MGICAYNVDLDSEYYALFDFSQRVENKETDLRYFKRLSRFFDPHAKGDFGDFLASLETCMYSMAVYMENKSDKYKALNQIDMAQFLKDFSVHLRKVSNCIGKLRVRETHPAKHRKLISLVLSCIYLARENESLNIGSQGLIMHYYTSRLNKVGKNIDAFMFSLES